MGLFETIQLGIVYQDAKGRITSANPAACSILGLDLEQMQGRRSIDPRWRAIREDGTDFPGDTHPSMVSLKTGRPVTGVIMGVFHPTEQEHRWINVSAVPEFREGEAKPYRVYTTFTDITERTLAETALRQRTHDLAERIKELQCLYGLASLVEEHGNALDKILKGVADLIPPSCQYPSITCARITLEGQKYETDNFKKTRWRLACDIRVWDEEAGSVEVFYLDKRPKEQEGPFLKEERSLIDALAKRIGKVVERGIVEERNRLIMEKSPVGISITTDKQLDTIR